MRKITKEEVKREIKRVLFLMPVLAIGIYAVANQKGFASTISTNLGQGVSTIQEKEEIATKNEVVEDKKETNKEEIKEVDKVETKTPIKATVETPAKTPTVSKPVEPKPVVKEQEKPAPQPAPEVKEQPAPQPQPVEEVKEPESDNTQVVNTGKSSFITCNYGEENSASFKSKLSETLGSGASQVSNKIEELKASGNRAPQRMTIDGKTVMLIVGSNISVSIR